MNPLGFGPLTPTPGPILLRLWLDEIGAPQFSFEIFGPPRFEFRRVSGNSSRRGATFENGRGQV